MSKAVGGIPGWLLGVLLLAACGEPQTTRTLGTNSNWFVTCHDDGECNGSASCECARCTLTCEADADCSGLADARCAVSGEPSVLSQCAPDATPAGLCLPRCVAGSCAADEACVTGSCISNAVPDNDFCAPVALPGAPDRSLEDELFELVEAMRAAGGVTCGTEPDASPSASPLRASGSLTCAARVFAADRDQSGGQDLTDSSGRGTEERMQAAGYSPSLWAEGFAVGASSASDALAIMLADASACTGLTRTGYVDLGVAHVGRVYVATLGWQ